MRMAAFLLLAACSGQDKKPGKTPSSGADDTGSTVDDTGSGPDPYDVVVGPYEVDIRWTGYGIPHITADDWGSLGYGIGSAQARHHVCAIADQVVMARSERSLYFGRSYVDMDFGYKGMRVFENAERGFLSLDQPLQDLLVGYAAGYNAWIAENDLPPECAGADWVKPITHIDLLAYYLALSELASGAAFTLEIGQAEPPGASSRAAPPPALPAALLEERSTLGSNGWAIGSERSESGGGMLLSNTHYPWFGNRRWFEMHITIPGEVDFYGVALAGVMIPVMGFNQDIAWTHTVAYSSHFVLNSHLLDPTDPTRYLYDGEYRDMEEQVYSIQVKTPDGSIETVERTLYRSHRGPMLNAPLVGWSDVLGVSITDVNENNLNIIRTWFGMLTADSMAELQDAQWTHRGIPWVNTIATSKEGEAWYADTTRVPDWSDDVHARWLELREEQPLVNLMAGYGVFAADGSDPLFDLGILPAEQAPALSRSDYVANANDSHWLSHAETTLDGYPLIYGPERTPRSGRTRMNLRVLSETGEGSASGEDGRFSLEELEMAALSGRSIHAEELLPALVERCNHTSTITLSGTEVDLQPACEAMAGWSGRYDLDAEGFAPFRELLGSSRIGYANLDDAGQLYAIPFDPDDPVDTPNTLVPAPEDPTADPVLLALADGVLALQEAGVSPTARLGDVQFQKKGEETFSVPGGGYVDGTIAVADWSGGNDTLLPLPSRGTLVNPYTDLTNQGYVINNGNSWVMAMEFTDAGPRARAILTYSQSADPNSPHYADQSALLADTGALRPILFTNEEIAADPALTEEHLSLPQQ